MTQPGRTFGKGGFISAIWLTILSSLGKSGSSEVPANEWLKAVHSDQVEQKLASIRWSRILILSIFLFWPSRSGLDCGFTTYNNSTKLYC